MEVVRFIFGAICLLFVTITAIATPEILIWISGVLFCYGVFEESIWVCLISIVLYLSACNLKEKEA